MTVPELLNAGAIYVKQLQSGLKQYENEIVKMNGDGAVKFFTGKIEGGSARLYLDFYYFVLDESARIKVDGELSHGERIFLKRFKKNDGEFLFPAEKELIQIAAKLNESEMLFSSFYLVEREEASIWWGNYGGEYIVMKKKR